MKIESLTQKEIENGYQYDKDTKTYRCIICETEFFESEYFPIDNKFYNAEYAIKRHIQDAHDGMLSFLINNENKYNNLTVIQKDLLMMFASKMSDEEIAKKLKISQSTIRSYRFTFREKMKSAKYYLAMYNLTFDNKMDPLLPINHSASVIDERFIITDKERQDVLDNHFASYNPLVMKTFPAKQKKKLIALQEIIKKFQSNRYYTEVEVNEILKKIYHDYVTIRRYLIEYGYMDRANDGSKYWLK